VVGGKKTKVPYFSKTKRSSSTDPSTWKTYDEAETALDNGSNKFDGVGIFFKDDLLLLGVDIDHCIEDGKYVHPQLELIEKFLDRSNTYTEISPSRTGLHLFFKLTEPYTLTANKKAPFEIYNRARFLTVTNQNISSLKEVRTVTPKEMDEILSEIGYPWTKKEKALPGKMFNSKIGAKLKALYNGDTSEYDNDKSSADYGLCSTLAFWSGRDEAQIERLWLASPLGQREKTKERKDYRSKTVTKAVANCSKVYETTAMRIEKENPQIEFLCSFNKDGEAIVVQNTENICRVLRDHPHFAGRFRYDTFKNVYQIHSTLSNEWRQFEDSDSISLQTSISILFPPFYKVGKEMVYDAVIKVCKENTMDSAIDYIKAIQWDGKARLDTWLGSVYGVADNVYHRAVGSNWLKGMVKRLVEPGCKFDFVLVLEGKQGVKKSTSLSILGGDWHVETTMSTDTKDFFMQFAGKSIIEFSEGETMSRTEVKKMKAIITMQYDRFRMPYERTTKDFPRRCVFAMTTNQTEYLKDETGNRRWLPVLVESDHADIEWLAANRDQLFAEAYHRVVTLKETTYELPEKETLAEQQLRRIRDPYADPVAHWYYNILKRGDREQGITVLQVFQQVHCGGSSFGKQMAKWEEMSISGILKDMGLLSRQSTVNKVRASRWYNPNAEVELTETEEIISTLAGNF
jgi:putative DNA primase/helicase